MSTRYIVISCGDQWKISHGEKHYGPYATQKAALNVAIHAAYSVGRRGLAAQVLIQEADNGCRTGWTYGEDPYPPQG